MAGNKNGGRRPAGADGGVSGGDAYGLARAPSPQNLDDPEPATLSVDDLVDAEGYGGTTTFFIMVTRTGDTSSAVSASWTLTLPGGANSADGDDLHPTQAMSGTVTFEEGVLVVPVEISVSGDADFEPDEHFTFTLSDPVNLSDPMGDAAIGDGVATITIQNDDVESPIIELDGVAGGSTTFTATYVENDADGEPISAPLPIVTAPSDVIVSMTIVITDGQAGDQLVLSDTIWSGITSSGFDPETFTLTLSGDASGAQYAEALSYVRFIRAGDDPAAAGETRAIVVTVDNGVTTTPATSLITIQGVDDAATIGGTATGSVTEDGALTASGLLTVNDVDNDEALLEPVAAGTPGANHYGTFEVLADGNWTYMLNNALPAVQALNNGQTLTDTITVTTADGTDSETISVTIHGVDEPPPPVTVDLDSGAAGYDYAGAFTENGSPVAIGNGIDIVAAGPDIAGAVVQLTDSQIGDQLTYDSSLTGGLNVIVNATLLQFTGFAPIAQYEALLASIRYVNTGDNPTTNGNTDRIIAVYVSDPVSASNSPTSYAVIAVTGVNDVTQLSGQTTAIAFENNHTPVTGTINATDLDFNEARVQAQNGVAGTYGNFSIAQNGQWTYSPNDNNYLREETVTDTFTVTSIDNSATIDVVITIFGSNDYPLTAQYGTTGMLTEDGGAYSASGYAVASDPDHDENGFRTGTFVSTYGTFVITNVPGAQQGNWSYTLDNAGAATQGLGGGQSVVDSMQMLTVDGSTYYTLQILIHGVNDAATISGANAGNVYEDGVLTASGTLVVSDVDNGENGLVTQNVLGANGYGTFLVNADGTWTYTLNNDLPAIQALPTGTSLADYITVYSTDGTDSEMITVLIHGRDEGTNTPPTVGQGVADFHFEEDTALSYEFAADAFNDAEGNLSYSATLADGSPLPSWLHLFGAARTFLGTPPQDSHGTLSIRVTATDGEFSVYDDFELTIDPVNDAPVATIAGPPDGFVTIGGEVHVNSYTPNGQDTPSVAALVDGGYVVVWHSFNQDGFERGIYAQRYGADGVAIGGEVRVSSTFATDQSYPAVTALGDGGYVIAWHSYFEDGSDYGVYARRYGPDGIAQGGQVLVNSVTLDSQRLPSVAGLEDGGYVFTWESLNQDGSGYGVYARRFDAAGNPGSEISVNASTTDDQTNPSVAGLSDGGFVIVWHADDAGGGHDIFARRYDASGATTGDDVLVNSVTIDTQINASVAGLSGGGYVVVWQSSRQEGNYSIYAQRYDANGVAQGGEVRVNTATANDQMEAAVAALADGGYVVTWQSQGQDGSGFGIFAQAYDANGVAVGGETPVNTTGANNQSFPSVAGLADSGYIVAWTSNGQEGANSEGIFSQRYGAVPGDFTAVEQVALSLKGTMSVADVDGGSAIESVTLSVGYGVLNVTAGDSGVTIFGGNGTASVEVRGTLAQLNAFLGSGSTSTIAYTANSDAPPASTTLTLTVNDFGNSGAGGVLTGSDSETITILGINDAPTSSGLSGDAAAWTEGQAQAALLDVGSNAVLADVDSIDFSTGTLTVAITGGLNAAQDQLVIRLTGTVTSNGTAVFVNGTQIATYTGAGAGGGPLVFTFDEDATPAAVSELIRAIAYANSNVENPTPGLRTIGWTFVDGDGTANMGADTHQVTSSVNVIALNDAPVIGLLANNTVQYVEGGAPVRLDLGSNATVTDVDSADFGGGSLTVAITGGNAPGEDVLGLDGSGTIALSNGANVGSEISIGGTVFATVTASANGSITIGFDSDATPARIQELLRIFAYTNTNALDPSTAQRTINWTLVDGDGTAGGGADTRTVSSFVAVTPVNDAPSGTSATIDILEDTPRTLTADDFGFSDVDGHSLIAVLVSPPSAGTLLFNGNPVTDADTFVTLAQLNAGNLVFVPAPDANGDGYAGFDFRVVDAGGNFNGEQDTDPSANTLTFDVTPVNDAPVLNPAASPVLDAVNEDAGAPAGPVGTLVSSLVDFPSPAEQNDNVTEVDSGALLGIAITGVSGLGTLYYSLDGGDTWAAVGPVSDGSALLLAADADTRIYFQPNANFNGSVGAAITFRAWDQNSGIAGTFADTSTNGGTTAFSSATDSASLTVNAVNDAPVSTGFDDVTFVEGMAYTQLDVGFNQVLTDIDSANFDGGTLTFQVTGNFLATEDRLTFLTGGTSFLSVSGNTLLYHNVAFATFSPSGVGLARTFTFNANATVEAVQTVMRNLAYLNQNQADPSTAQRTIEYVLTDGDGGTLTLTSLVTIVGVNDAPTSAGLAGDTVTYTENGAAVLLDPGGDASLADVDSADFNGGTLTVAVTGNCNAAQDVLGIGTGGSISLSDGTNAGSIVSHLGNAIGTITASGIGGNLVIALDTANANGVSAAALLQALTYRNSSDNPATGQRDITITLTDGDGAANNGADAVTIVTHVGIAPQNDAPTLDLNGGGTGANNAVTYLENAAPVLLAANAVLGDVDSMDFDGGYVRAEVVLNSQGSDVLTILDQGSGPGQIGVTNGMVTYGGVQIGSLTPSGNAGLLVVTLNASATAIAVEALVRALAYFAPTDLPPGGTRGILIAVADGDGASLSRTATVTVTPVDDAPVAQPDAFTIAENGTIIGGDLFGSNGAGADGDVDGPPLSISAVNGSGANVGTQIVLESGALLTVNAGGTFDYDPNGAFLLTPDPGSGASNTLGRDSFTYTLAGGNSVTVSITLSGLDTNDLLLGTAGADILIGGAGNDTYLADGTSDQVIEAAGEGYDAVYAAANYSLGAGQEIEVLSAYGLEGTSPLTLAGNAFAQSLIGNAGANFLIGGGGADVFYGLLGNDTYLVDSADDLVIEYAGQGTDAVYSSVDYTLAAGQEIEVLGAYGQDVTSPLALFGNALSQALIGNAGANFLVGGGGADVFYGLLGNDTYLVDSADDFVIEYAGQGNDAIYAAVDYSLAAGQEVEVLSVFGQEGTNPLMLAGNGFAQTLIGNAGNNFLIGGGGADIFYGLGGNDTYLVDSADDLVLEYAGQGYDAVYAAASYTLSAGQEVELLSAYGQEGLSPLNLTGNAAAQAIIGNNGTNFLDGGGGADVLYGLGGNDTFAFTTAPGAGNIDTIADFVAGTDRIALDDVIFAGIGAVGVLNASAFVTGAAAADGSDRIIYDNLTGRLLYDADGTGGIAAVQFATITAGLNLTAGDFIII